MDSDQDGSQRVASEMILPLVAEELDISKVLKEKGRIRVTKRVNHTPALVEENLRSEHYEVKHVRVDRQVDAPVQPRQEGDTLILPVLEEVLVVEKRLMLVEEVHITRRIDDVHQRREVDLRKEEVNTERLER